MTVYNDPDRIERIVATFFRIRLEDLLTLERALEDAIASRKGRARQRAMEMIYPID